jgi:hypothetical protein
MVPPAHGCLVLAGFSLIGGLFTLTEGHAPRASGGRPPDGGPQRRGELAGAGRLTIILDKSRLTRPAPADRVAATLAAHPEIAVNRYPVKSGLTGH